MKHYILSCLLVLFTLLLNAQPSQNFKLWYDKPANLWVESLPLGNGRIGAMVFGTPAHEEFQLNEETIWAGSPYNNTNAKAKDALPQIRELIFNGRNKEAQDLCGPTIIAPNNAYGMPYQTVGSLLLDFEGMDNYTNYYRELDIERAISTTRFTASGVNYTREAFTSFPDQMLVIRLTASQPGKLSFTTRYTTPYQNVVRSITDKKRLRMDGKGSDHEGVEGKVRFTTLTHIQKDGGKLELFSDTLLRVSNANSVTLYVSIGTNFVNYKDVSGNALAQAEKHLKNVTKNYVKAKQAHIDYYAGLFNRVSLDLGSSSQISKPTDIRLKEFGTTFDPHLVALYFQFGRYLLMSSSQPGGQPANLQGIWNHKLYAPWDGKFAGDINVEMNYWPAEVTNLSELHIPFIDLIKNTALQGRQSAEMYGCRGWTLHHITDIWCATGAVDGPDYGVWPTCNAWFCQHLWDRYLFSGDEKYLKEIYPIMKGACEFFLDFLVCEPKNNWLVVAPSYSPENSPIIDGKRRFAIVAGATIDNQLVSDLFHNTIEAAALIEESKIFIDSLQTVVNNLPPMQIGRWGQLQEWMEDWDDPKDHHRHISHLWGLYPGRQINLYDSPTLLEAVRKSLLSRGDHSTGWSMGWKVCLWARLLDGNRAYKLITEQLVPTLADKGVHGGTYPNLFDAHPPFQIDGNFGCTAGIAEMLVQSHAGAVHLLPALPDAWDNGVVRGLRCRGGFILDEMKWEKGKLSSVCISSSIGGVLRIRTSEALILNGKRLTPVTTECSNWFLKSQKIRKPIILSNIDIENQDLKVEYLYDIATIGGDHYSMTVK